MEFKKEEYLNVEGLLIPIDKICAVGTREEKSPYIKDGYIYSLYINYMYSDIEILIAKTTDKKEFDSLYNEFIKIVDFKKEGV